MSFGYRVAGMNVGSMRKMVSRMSEALAVFMEEMITQFEEWIILQRK